MAIPPSTRTPAYQHACTFANKDGVLTDASISARQAELNDTGYVADVRRRAVLSAAGDNPTVEHICSFANQARSGCWNIDGTPNPERLRILKDRCVKAEDGTLLITRSIFQAFIDERRASLNKGFFWNILSFGNVTWIKPFPYCPFKVPIPYTAVTDGSVDAFFNADSDRKYKGEPAVTWEKASIFYDPQNTTQLRD